MKISINNALSNFMGETLSFVYWLITGKHLTDIIIKHKGQVIFKIKKED